jgi:hypothetical protein
LQETLSYQLPEQVPDNNIGHTAVQGFFARKYIVLMPFLFRQLKQFFEKKCFFPDDFEI